MYLRGADGAVVHLRGLLLGLRHLLQLLEMLLLRVLLLHHGGLHRRGRHGVLDGRRLRLAPVVVALRKLSGIKLLLLLRLSLWLLLLLLDMLGIAALLVASVHAASAAILLLWLLMLLLLLVLLLLILLLLVLLLLLLLLELVMSLLGLVLVAVLRRLRLLVELLPHAIRIYAVLVMHRAILLGKLVVLRLVLVHLLMLGKILLLWLVLVLLVRVALLASAHAISAGVGAAVHVSVARIALPGRERALVGHDGRNMSQPLGAYEVRALPSTRASMRLLFGAGGQRDDVDACDYCITVDRWQKRRDSGRVWMDGRASSVGGGRRSGLRSRRSKGPGGARRTTGGQGGKRRRPTGRVSDVRAAPLCLPNCSGG